MKNWLYLFVFRGFRQWHSNPEISNLSVAGNQMVHFFAGIKLMEISHSSVDRFSRQATGARGSLKNSPNPYQVILPKDNRMGLVSSHSSWLEKLKLGGRN
jgi:hypothetical protein